MKKIKTISLITVTALVTVIFIQNSQSVVFRIFFWDINMPRIVMLLTVFLAGILFGLFLALFRRRPAAKQGKNAVSKDGADKPDEGEAG